MEHVTDESTCRTRAFLDVHAVSGDRRSVHGRLHARNGCHGRVTGPRARWLRCREGLRGTDRPDECRMDKSNGAAE